MLLTGIAIMVKMAKFEYDSTRSKISNSRTGSGLLSPNDLIAFLAALAVMVTFLAVWQALRPRTVLPALSAGRAAPGNLAPSNVDTKRAESDDRGRVDERCRDALTVRHRQSARPWRAACAHRRLLRNANRYCDASRHRSSTGAVIRSRRAWVSTFDGARFPGAARPADSAGETGLGRNACTPRGTSPSRRAARKRSDRWAKPNREPVSSLNLRPRAGHISNFPS